MDYGKNFNKIDNVLLKYYREKNTALLNELDELRKEQRKTLEQKRRGQNERVNTNQE